MITFPPNSKGRNLITITEATEITHPDGSVTTVYNDASKATLNNLSVLYGALAGLLTAAFAGTMYKIYNDNQEANLHNNIKDRSEMVITESENEAGEVQKDTTYVVSAADFETLIND